MNIFDIFVIYLYSLKSVLLVTMIVIAFCSIDDLFIDIYYWVRRFWRSNTIYKNFSRKEVTDLIAKDEAPLAILIPAWHEFGVIDKMAKLAASELDYENYQIFIGTYPNDPKTQADVDDVCENFSNVHKIVCAREGPTSKADCLNNIIAAIIEFEKKAKIEFAGFILHDAEDIISAQELSLFNYLLPKKDLIQLPVYPYTRKWHQFTAGHYADEFAEMHGKDVVVREALAGQVPSAGVGTCFSRKAILHLLVEGDGLPFDVRSLTEDYDIGFRLKQHGMQEVFVRYPVLEKQQKTLREYAVGVSLRSGNVICVREYFPDTYSTAIKQKSRWIVGIVFQGFQNHKWTKDWKVNYFLWRDRRGFINNTVSFIATLLLLQLLLLSLYATIVPNNYNFMDVIANDNLTKFLLIINTFFFINRIIQRFYFVSQYYGYFEGLLSFARIFWGNIINFMANVRALKLVLAHGDSRKVAWDKTSHYFPSIATSPRRKPLGTILVASASLTIDQLKKALLACPKDMLLGMYLVKHNFITNEQLSKAIAFQAHRDYKKVDPFTVDVEIINRVPKKLALKYSILPVEFKDNVLLLARETALTPVALAALKRKLNCNLDWCIGTNGAVTLGLRYWYLDNKKIDPREILTTNILAKNIKNSQIQRIMDIYFASVSKLGSCLISARLIEPAVLYQGLLAFDATEDISLGKFLVSREYISQAQLEQALKLQTTNELTIDQIIEMVNADE